MAAINASYHFQTDRTMHGIVSNAPCRYMSMDVGEGEPARESTRAGFQKISAY